MPPITPIQVRDRLGIRGGMQAGANVQTLSDETLTAMVAAAQSQIEARWGLDARDYSTDTRREFVVMTREQPYGIALSRRPLAGIAGVEPIVSVVIGIETQADTIYELDGQHLVRTNGFYWQAPTRVTYYAEDCDDARREAIYSLIDIWLGEGTPNTFGNRVSNRMNDAVQATIARVGFAEHGVFAL